MYYEWIVNELRIVYESTMIGLLMGFEWIVNILRIDYEWIMNRLQMS